MVLVLSMLCSHFNIACWNGLQLFAGENAHALLRGRPREDHNPHSPILLPCVLWCWCVCVVVRVCVWGGGGGGG
jgi:hypothetical protein